MTSTAQKDPSEWQRLASVSSLVDSVERHVSDLVQVSPDDLPQWLTSLGVPTGWRLASLQGDGFEPSRIAVCTPHSGAGYACETISLFKFTGMPTRDVLHDRADCTLRDLDAENITTHALMTPTTPGVTAVRSSGYFSTDGLSVWAQYSTYVAGSDVAGAGRLIQHSVFAESDTRAALSNDIEQLSNAVRHAFLASMRDIRYGRPGKAETQ